MNNIKKTIIPALFLFTLLPLFVFAQNEKGIVPCDKCNVQDAVTLIEKILDIAFLAAGFIVATMFMYAGFILITAAGDTGKIQKAKDIFKRVIIGFLIMYMSYLLVSNLLTKIGVVEFFTKLIK